MPLSNRILSLILCAIFIFSTFASVTAYADEQVSNEVSTEIVQSETTTEPATTQAPVVLNGWSSDKKYYYINGNPANGLVKINGHYYLFSNTGKVKTGWVKYNKKTYYCSKSKKKYGQCVTGIVKIEGKKYKFNKKGELEGQITDMDIKADTYSSPTKYLILVSKKDHRVGIYKGKKGNWKKVKNFKCTIGAKATPTPSGDFNVGPKNGKPFHQLYFDSGRVRCWYATRIVGGINFHSVLYTQNKKPTTISNGTLGQNLSHGCIRLEIKNAKWIYDNIPKNTRCIIY